MSLPQGLYLGFLWQSLPLESQQPTSINPELCSPELCPWTWALPASTQPSQLLLIGLFDEWGPAYCAHHGQVSSEPSVMSMQRLPSNSSSSP